jgi:uncharacterized protein (DUF2062 family)
MSGVNMEFGEGKLGFLRRWFVQPIWQQLTQGVTPRKLAQALAWGLTVGIFPILGSTTLLAFCVGVPLRLNQPVLQAFKVLATPLQWFLLLGFYRAGEWLFRAPHVSVHIPTMMKRFFAEPGPFFQDYGMTALYGMVVWCLVAPLVLGLTYCLALPLVEGLAAKLRRPVL